MISRNIDGGFQLARLSGSQALSLNFCTVVTLLIASTGDLYGQTKVSVEPPDRSQMIQVIAEKFPATLDIELGDMALSEQTLKWVEITNRTGEQFCSKSVKSDCGCALGVVLDEVVEHGGVCRAYVRAIPSATGVFSRTITIANSEGSDRSISLRVKGNVKPRFATEPSTLKLYPRTEKDYELKLIANFEDEFAFDKAVSGGLPNQIALQHLPNQSNSKALSLKLTVLEETPVSFPSNCQVTFEAKDQQRHTVNIQLYWNRDPKVIPSLIKLRRDQDAKFFLTGDFGFPVEELAKAKLLLKVGKTAYSVESNWKNEGLCACKVRPLDVPVGDETDMDSELWIQLPNTPSKLIARMTCSLE